MVLLCAWGDAFSQGNIVQDNLAEQQVVNNTDSLALQAAFNLLSFSGANSSGQNTLTWKTDSRSHFSSFTLERSVDETVFSAIGDVSAASSNKTNSFTYADNKPLPGHNFYRLKMTDSSGKSIYSTVIAITYIAVNNLQVHYDAASGTVTITGIEAGNACQLKVYNCNGQIMLQKTTTTTALSISISQLPHGLYVVYATDGAAALVSRKIIW